MELLAPAGSFAAFDAAITEGADAVYVGAPGLNARALTRDFNVSELGSMIRYAHRNNVKVYIAMNSLVKESELPVAVKNLHSFESFGADGLILQDIGLFSLAIHHFPGLPLHASTLMSVHNSLSARHFIELGGKRVVLPRELEIDEIGKIFARTGVELEAFVHGAMCFSYSGLCLFSSLHGGKSSLRGQCVQPCRRRYTWLKKKGGIGKRQPAGKGGGYIFSMNDLSAIELLPELSSAGVRSLKIEGRLKSAEYVRKTVRAYRLVLDSLARDEAELRKSQIRAKHLLEEAMGRRWSTGFFLSRQPAEAVSPQFSGNVGTMVGIADEFGIRKASGGRQTSFIHATLKHPVRVGDRLRLHNENTGQRTSFTLHSLWIGRKKIRQGNPGQKVRIESAQQFPDTPVKKFKGSLFRVDIGSGKQEELQARDKILQYKSDAAGIDEKRIASILNETICQDDSGKELSHSTITFQGDAEGHEGKRNPSWWVKVARFNDMQYRLPVDPAIFVLPMTEENVAQGLKYHAKQSGNVVWSLPPVILEHRVEWFVRAVSALCERNYTQYQLGHSLQFSLFEEMKIDKACLRLYGDYTNNILNSQSLKWLRQSGFCGSLFSIETDRGNLADTLKDFAPFRSNFLVGMYVYGRPALFNARLDAAHLSHGKRFASPKGEEYILGRIDDMTTARSTIPFSLLTVWRDLVSMHVDYLYADLSFGNIKRSASEFIGHYHRGKGRPPAMTGNFFESLS